MKNINLTALIKKTKSGKYIGQLQEFPAVLSQGNTEEELVENLYDAFQLLMDSYKKDNKTLASAEGIIKKRKLTLA